MRLERSRSLESKEEKSTLETTQEKRHLWLRLKEKKKISYTMIDSNCNRNRFFIFLLNFFLLQKTQVARE